MQCRDARELLDSFIGEELLVETNHDLLRHLAACPECTAELEERRRIRAGLKHAFSRSDDLRLRPQFARELTARLRTSTQPAPRQRWQSRWLAVAASLLVLAGAGAYVMRARISEVSRLAAGDHKNCAVKFALAEKPVSLKEAAERFDPSYAQLETTPPDTVRTVAGTLHVADRHSCVFAGRRFGHVVFRLDDHLVSVLMTKNEDDVATAKAGARSLALLPRLDGFGMASLQTSRHLVYIVSDLPDAEFRPVAQALAQPVSGLTALGAMATVRPE